MLELYDNTRIIIVSDHGNGMYLFDGFYTDDYEFMTDWFVALLLVKDYDSTGYTTDSTFMTIADVPTLALEDIVDYPVNPHTGEPINSEPKHGDIYVEDNQTYDERLWNPEANQGNTFYYNDDYLWFKIVNENIYDLNNWVETDYPLNGS